MNSNIHKLSKFPAFTWSQEALNELVLSLRIKQDTLLKRMDTLSVELKQEASTLILRQDIIANIEIEQNLPFFEQFLTILSQNEHFLGKNASFLTDSTQNYKATLTKERLLTWLPQFSQGNLNATNIQLDQFLAWFNKPGLDRLLKAAIAHLWFVSIAPFNGGNGFVSRLITDMQLAKADGTHYRYYSFSNQLLKEQDDYQFILEQVQKGSLDITIWLQWFLNCLGRAYDASDNLLSLILKKDAFWKKHVDVIVNKRQKQIINTLLQGLGEKLSTTTYASLTKCSRDTALRDITDLMEKNILIKKEGLGKNTNYHLSH